MNDEEYRIIELGHHLRTYGECAPGGNETWAEWDALAECYLRRQLGGEDRCCAAYGEKDHGAFPRVVAAREAARAALSCDTTMIHHMGSIEDRRRHGFDSKGHPPNCPAHGR